MGGIRRRAGWVAALLAATTALACEHEPRPAKPLATALPSREAIHTELHRRQLVARLDEIRGQVKAADELPTLCRLTRQGSEERALAVTRRMLRALAEPGTELPSFDARLNAAAFVVLSGAADGVDEQSRELVMEAIDDITDHRYLAVIQPQRHRPPAARGDRVVASGRLEGEVVLFDTEEGKALCRGAVDASTSSSMNAYGDMDEEAFARDLGVNFLRAVEAQLERATGGMKLAWDEDASPPLASHGASAPSATPP